MRSGFDQSLKEFLDSRYRLYNNPKFIEHDPICVPHRFTKKQDIEISAFWIAMLAWGQRVTIINKGLHLMKLMDFSPYQFVTQHEPQDLKVFQQFKHRTFNGTDTLYFLDFFKRFYQSHDSLEQAFLPTGSVFTSMKNALTFFHEQFFDCEHAPERTRKHVATPARNSACKRINMFLRWMVRHDQNGVDFGLWKSIKPKDLVCPCDLHVDRVARKLGLISRKQTDWQTALELTRNLAELDPLDPVKYDFALFGLGVMERD